MKYNAPHDTAIIVVDVQNGFCTGGNLAVPGGEEIVPLVNQVASKFGVRIFTQDFHPAGHASFASSHGRDPMENVWMKDGEIVGEIIEGAEDTPPVEGAIKQTLWPDHCVQNSPDSEFHPDLDIHDDDTVLQKGYDSKIDSYSGFWDNGKQDQPRFDNGSTLAETLREIGINRVVLVGLAGDFCVGYHGLDALEEGFEVVVVKDATRSIAVPLGEGVTTETLMDQQLKDAGALIVNSDELDAVLQPQDPAAGSAPPTPGM